MLPYLTDLGANQVEIDAVAERVERRYEASQHSIRDDMLLFMDERDQAGGVSDRAADRPNGEELPAAAVAKLTFGTALVRVES